MSTKVSVRTKKILSINTHFIDRHFSNKNKGGFFHGNLDQIQHRIDRAYKEWFESHAFPEEGREVLFARFDKSIGISSQQECVIIALVIQDKHHFVTAYPVTQKYFLKRRDRHPQ